MKPKVKPLITLTFFSLIGVDLLMAGIITVKQDGTGDYTTIQAGMNACVWNSGDTVLVWPGVYYENIIYNGKHITVASLYMINQDKWYIYNTIIDGNHAGACVTMNGGQNTLSIDGFMIRNGKNSNGGGIFCNLATVSIKNSIIEYNKAVSGGGGGLYCIQSNAFLSGTTIKFNQAIGAGGIFCNHYSNIIFDPVIKCNIYNNFGTPGSDYAKSYLSPEQTIIVDTFTVINPDNYFISSFNNQNIPVNDVTIELEHGYLQPANFNLYVNPVTGNDMNSGANSVEALKTIAFAQLLIKSDSLNPHNIYLANGIYSPSTNEEKLPLGTRSYISLIGESMDSTIIDADSLSSFIRGFGNMKNYSIKDITFNRAKGGIYIERNDNLLISNVQLTNSGSKNYNALFIGYSDSITVVNISVVGYRGRRAFDCSNPEQGVQKTFRISNCSVLNNIHSNDPITGGEGGGIGIIGSYQLPYAYTGEIINLQVTNNLRIPDPLWGPGMVVGFLANQYCKINLINSTIVHNVLRGSYGFGTNATSGAELNIYNSILYGDSLKELSLGYPNILDDPAICRVNYSNIEGGQNEVQNWNGINTLVWGPGNIDSDPLWDTTAAIPYSIPYDSPCRNTGTPIYSPGMQPPYIIQQDTIYSLVTPEYDTIVLPSTDLRGKTRIMEGRIDMGAYEYDPFTGTDEQKLPAEVEVISVYPNPFYSNVFVSLDIKKAGYVKAEIYDMQGHLLKSLMDGDMPVGSCSLTWDGKDELGWDVKIGEYLLKLSLDGKPLPGAKIVRGKRK